MKRRRLLAGVRLAKPPDLVSAGRDLGRTREPQASPTPIPSLRSREGQGGDRGIRSPSTIKVQTEVIFRSSGGRDPALASQGAGDRRGERIPEESQVVRLEAKPRSGIVGSN